MIERWEEPTPRGGAYAVVSWRDSEGKEVERERATVALVSEYTADGRWLGESVLTLRGQER